MKIERFIEQAREGQSRISCYRMNLYEPDAGEIFCRLAADVILSLCDHGVETKFRVLNEQFSLQYDRNPIETDQDESQIF